MSGKKGAKHKKPRSEEARRKIGEAVKRRFADPAARQAHSERCKDMWKSGFAGNTGKKWKWSAEARKRMSETQKALWATPEYQARIAAQKAAWTPERRAAASAFAKALISD